MRTRLLFTLLRQGCLLWALWWSALAAADPAVQNVQLLAKGQDVVLNADVELSLSAAMEGAARRGIPLYFSVEVELLKPRWYWFNNLTVAHSQTWRILHNPLTRQWRVDWGSLALPVGSMEEALSLVRHVRGWRIAHVDEIDPDATYQGRVRARFDASRLPKPLQFSTLSDSEWSVATPWQSFDVAIEADAASAAHRAELPLEPEAEVPAPDRTDPPSTQDQERARP